MVRCRQLTVDAPLETGHTVLVAFTAAAFLTFVCTGLIIAVRPLSTTECVPRRTDMSQVQYARFLPPPTTRIWDLVRGIVSYLFVRACPLVRSLFLGLTIYVCSCCGSSPSGFRAPSSARSSFRSSPGPSLSRGFCRRPAAHALSLQHRIVSLSVPHDAAQPVQPHHRRPLDRARRLARALHPCLARPALDAPASARRHPPL